MSFPNLFTMNSYQCVGPLHWGISNTESSSTYAYHLQSQYAPWLGRIVGLSHHFPPFSYKYLPISMQMLHKYKGLILILKVWNNNSVLFIIILEFVKHALKILSLKLFNTFLIGIGVISYLSSSVFGIASLFVYDINSRLWFHLFLTFYKTCWKMH